MRSFFNNVLEGLDAFSANRFPYAQFAKALAIGLAGALLFVYLKTPLPWMLGSIAATTIAALAGVRITAPGVVRTPMVVIVGVMVGATFTPDIFGRFSEWWATVTALLILSLVLSAACTVYLSAFADFNLPTAYFSAMPGGLIEMVTLADERKGDIRTVALVHSVRILVIVFSVPFIVRAIEHASLSAPSVVLSSVVNMQMADLGWIIGTGVAGVVVGRLLRMPAAYLLGPLTASALIHAFGISEFRLPTEFLNAAQLVIGTSVGCRFAGVASSTVFRIIRIAVGMTLILLAFTVFFAWIVSGLLGYRFAPLLLAYAPGGLPEMSLVAVSLHIEVAFVAFHHIVRLFLVMGGAPLAFFLLDKKQRAE
jgi:membrane AbrB-like protein